ncbi:putative RNA methyltransferase [Nonomuraea sp. NPDC003754]
MLADIVEHLRCPVCREGVRLDAGAVRCGHGHAFDVARQGYVSLLTGSQAPGTADSSAMVAARADFLGRGHYAPLARALAETAAACLTPAAPSRNAGAGRESAGPAGATALDPYPDTGRESAGPAGATALDPYPDTGRESADPAGATALDPYPDTGRESASPAGAAELGPYAAGGPGTGAPVIVDAGAGTGYYLGAVLDAVPRATGIAFDISKHAVKRAARAHERAGAFVADAWRPLPLGDAVADVVMNVFAPRNGTEFARVLRPGGHLIVVIPAGDHLSPLVRELGLLSVDEAKEHRVAESLRGFEETGRREVRFEMSLTREDVGLVVGMGPSAWHKDPDHLHHQIRKFPEWTSAIASFRLSIFTAPTQSRPIP